MIVFRRLVPCSVVLALLSWLLTMAALPSQTPLAWRRPGEDGPANLQGYRMAFDSGRERVVLVASSITSYAVDCETWEWDGSGWRFRVSLVRPPARINHGLVYDRTRGVTVLFGGQWNGTRLDDVWEWDGTTWRDRTPTSSTRPSARDQMGLAYDPARGSVLLFGGVNGKPQTLADTWAWDGTSWADLSPVTGPPARAGAVMVQQDASGQVLLAFGSSLDDTWIWDGLAETWTLAAVGGRPSSYLSRAAHDPTSGRTVMTSWGSHGVREWTGTAWISLLPPAAGGTQTSFVELVHADIGGHRSFVGYSEPNQTVELDAGIQQWQILHTSYFPRVADVIGYDAARDKLVAYDSAGTTTWERDQNGWVAKTSAAGATGAQGMVYDTVRRQLLRFDADMWAWDGTTWSKPTPAAPVPYGSGGVFAFDRGRNEVVMYSDANGGETWVNNGVSWSLRSTVGPSRRVGSAMAYDPVRQVTILFGGKRPQLNIWHNDTWQWDGTAWALVPVTAPPPPRQDHVLVHDAARGKMLLFGGSPGPNLAHSDTWSLAGNSWVQEQLASSPGPRSRHRAAFDASRARVVIFGGLTPDFWEFGGGCAIVGPGHELFGGLPIRCETMPVLGTTFTVSFQAPTNNQAAVFVLGGCLAQPLVVLPPTTCLKGFLYAQPALVIPAAQPMVPRLALPIPDVAGLENVTLCLQGIAVGAAGCALFTPGLSFTVIR